MYHSYTYEAPQCVIMVHSIGYIPYRKTPNHGITMYHNYTYESLKRVTVTHGVWYWVYNNPFFLGLRRAKY